jgi:hypothetical protein
LVESERDSSPFKSDILESLSEDFNDVIDQSKGYVLECSVPYRFNSSSVCEQFFFDVDDDDLLVFFTQS